MPDYCTEARDLALTVAEQHGATPEQFVDTTLGTLYGAERVPELKKPLEG